MPGGNVAEKRTQDRRIESGSLLGNAGNNKPDRAMRNTGSEQASVDIHGAHSDQNGRGKKRRMGRNRHGKANVDNTSEQSQDKERAHNTAKRGSIRNPETSKEARMREIHIPIKDKDERRETHQRRRTKRDTESSENNRQDKQSRLKSNIQDMGKRDNGLRTGRSRTMPSA